MFFGLLFRLPTGKYLPSPGVGAAIFLNVFASYSPKDCHSPSSALPVPLLSTSQSAVLIVSWLFVLSYMDYAREAWQRYQQTRKEMARQAKYQQQYQLVLDELVTTGLLSHMFRNAHCRVLPWVYHQQEEQAY